MKHTYTITGMTCNGCRTYVEDALNAIPEINCVEVNLEASEASIEMAQHISTDKLQKALSSKYHIAEKNIFNVSSETQTTKKSELQQLFPLFLIFFFIIGSSILLNYNPWNGQAFMLDFMGLFYIVFSFFKFLDLKGFPDSFRMYDPVAKVIPLYGWVYPFIELGLGTLFLMRIEITLALIVTLVILGITTIGVTKTLLGKKSIQCACLGTALKLPMTKATLIENTIMIVMAVVMLIKLHN